MIFTIRWDESMGCIRWEPNFATTPVEVVRVSDLISDEAVKAYAVAALDHNPGTVMQNEEVTVIRRGLAAAMQAVPTQDRDHAHGHQ